MRRDGYLAYHYAVFALGILLVLLLCVSLGSVSVPLRDTLEIIFRAVTGAESASAYRSIILSVRLPRVLCVALSGAVLSLCGAAMQGLLRNPLADGSTMGVSSGAALGAAVAILIGFTIPSIPFAGTMILAMLFSFLSLLLILSLTYTLDRSFSTHTIILIGVIFSMFVSSLMSLLITFSGERLRSITFWTMGSLAGSTYANALTIFAALVLFGGFILLRARELNAFAIGEDNARNIGVHVKRVKLTLLIAVSALIGICVSIGGTIGFIGLVTPHMARMVVGANHKKLLPASLFMGAILLMLADLAARLLLSPLELPIGVVTSLIGSVVFILIFSRSGKAKA